jgi:hypothetical protein
MLSFKIAIKAISPNSELIENNLINFNGYLVHNNSLIETNSLVNENNVVQFLNNPNNESVVNRFKQYLSAFTDSIEFNEIYYNAKKVVPILNDFYNEVIRFNSEPNPILIGDALENTVRIDYTDNNFNFVEGNRRDYNNIKDLIEVVSEENNKNYYISFKIDSKQKQINNNDYSRYIKDVEEDGVLLKNLFVNINKQTDPFEYWNNNRVRPSIGKNINPEVISIINARNRNF